MDQKIIERGERAKQTLQDEVISEALSDLENTLVDSWKAANTTEHREELWFTLKGLSRFKTLLEGAIVSGEYEASPEAQ